MNLTEQELEFFANNLRIRKTYEPMGLLYGYPVWQPWMESTLTKLTQCLNTLQSTISEE